MSTDSGDYSTATAAIFAARPPDYSGFGRTGRTTRLQATGFASMRSARLRLKRGPLERTRKW